MKLDNFLSPTSLKYIREIFRDLLLDEQAIFEMNQRKTQLDSLIGRFFVPLRAMGFQAASNWNDFLIEEVILIQELKVRSYD